MSRVAGIDRWRGGWIAAITEGTELELVSWPTICDAASQLDDCACIAIDIPIALVPEGRRRGEAELRSVLGASARSVFTSPTRAAIAASTQGEATIVNRANGGPGISSQAFGLFASIREVRAALASSPASTRWWETHPETAFAVMNGGTPLASKRTGRGVAERFAHLRPHFPTVDDVVLDAPAKVPIDDILDSIAAAWSARRIATGEAAIFGEAGRDDEGFALGIQI